MDGNEKLPKGWTKVQSKSRPDKVYFYNKETGVSLWKIEDLKKLDKGHIKVKVSKRPSPTSGVVSESKAIKKNGAKERMTKLKKNLTEEVAKQRGKDPANIPRQQKKKLPDPVKVSPTKLVAQVKSSRIVPEKKNIAAQRMSKLNKQLKRENPQEDSLNQEYAPTSSKSKVPIKFKEIEVATKVELPPKQDSGDVEMMDVSYENPSEELISDYETPMDWEEIPEEKIILEVQKIRTTNSTANRSQMSPGKKFSSSESDFFVIVDTNVLLSNIEFLKEIKGKMFKGENFLNQKNIIVIKF
jgi:WW domain